MQLYWFLCICAILGATAALPRSKRSPQFFHPGYFGLVGGGGYGPYGHYGGPGFGYGGPGYGAYGGHGYGGHGYGGHGYGGPGGPGRFHPRPFGSAYCRLVPANHSQNVMGEIFLDQPASLGPVQISGEVVGLTPGRHGFHIHEMGDTGDDCMAAGPHFNPNMMHHGAPEDKQRHAGDLGNIMADAGGVARFELSDSEISLVEDNPRNILMRAIVVHEMEDDLGKKDDDESKMTGNAGKRLACCIIEKPKYVY